MLVQKWIKIKRDVCIVPTQVIANRKIVVHCQLYSQCPVLTTGKVYKYYGNINFMNFQDNIAMVVSENISPDRNNLSSIP
jgi:hypothetical protein